MKLNHKATAAVLHNLIMGYDDELAPVYDSRCQSCVLHTDHVFQEHLANIADNPRTAPIDAAIVRSRMRELSREYLAELTK